MTHSADSCSPASAPWTSPRRRSRRRSGIPRQTRGDEREGTPEKSSLRGRTARPSSARRCSRRRRIGAEGTEDVGYAKASDYEALLSRWRNFNASSPLSSISPDCSLIQRSRWLRSFRIGSCRDSPPPRRRASCAACAISRRSGEGRVPGRRRPAALSPFAPRLLDGRGRTGPAGDGRPVAPGPRRTGPIFVKFGQALSTRADLLRSPDFIAEFSRLQDEVRGCR